MTFDIFPESEAPKAVFPLRNAAQLSDQRLNMELRRLGLRRFETVDDCRRRQIRDNALLEALGSVPQQTLRALRREERPHFDDLPHNSGASHRAKRLCRAETVLSASPFFEDEHESYLLSVVDSQFRRPEGQLNTIDPRAVIGPVADRLRRVRGDSLRAVFGVQVSFIEDFGRSYWAPQVLCVFTGADPVTVRDAMRRITRQSEAYRPVAVDPIKPGEVPKTIAYVIKRWSDRKDRYRAAGGQMESRRLSLPAALEAEHALWALNYEPRDFMAFAGIERNGRYLVTP